MTPAPNEETLVENAAVEQLKLLGWGHIQGHRFRPEVTERDDFRQVLLAGRLRAALRRINATEDGQEWLDESRLNQAVSALERLGGRDLIEANQRATELLLAGTGIDGDPELHGGRDVTIQYIDFDHPERNDFLAINQFRADLPGSGSPPRYIVVLYPKDNPAINRKKYTKVHVRDQIADRLKKYKAAGDSTNEIARFEGGWMEVLDKLQVHFETWEDVLAEIGEGSLDRFYDLCKRFNGPSARP